QADPSAVVQSRQQRRVQARGQRCSDGCLQVVPRCKSCRGNQGGMACVILPVVIGDENRSVRVTQLQCWIEQRIYDSTRSEARANATRNNTVRAAGAEDEARDD